MSKQANWATLSKKRRMRENGSEDRGAGSGDAPTVLASLFMAEGARSARLTRYLETGPRGERDVEALLDARQKDLLPQEPRLRDGSMPPRRTKGERDTWLRGVLDACPGD